MAPDSRNNRLRMAACGLYKRITGMDAHSVGCDQGSDEAFWYADVSNCNGPLFSVTGLNSAHEAMECLVAMLSRLEVLRA